MGPGLKVLSDTEIAKIHRGALSILERIGIEVREEQAFKLLKDTGCPSRGTIVRFPSDIVEKAIELAPATFTLYGRDPSYVVPIGKQRVCYEPMIGRLNIIDMETGARRRTTLDDVANLIRIADSLEQYSILHSGAIMPHIEGVPDEVAHVHGYYICVRNSGKVIKGVVRGKQKAGDCIRMAVAIAGGEENLREKPNIFTTCNVISPLQFDVLQTEGLIEYAKMGLPVDIASEPQSGATSPVTLAGTLTQQIAEVLGMNVVAQLVNPGTPVLLGTVAAAMDLHTGAIALGGVEAALLNVAHAQMAQFYQIPSRGTGCNTESKYLDIQAGYEKAITLILPALGGINLLFYPGTMDHALSISYEGLLIDHELCSMAERIVKGISVADDKIAIDIIEQVGQGGQHLRQKYTMRHLKSEHFSPGLSDRDSFEDWVERGKPSIQEEAAKKVKKILQEHRPIPLDPSVEKELTNIIQEVEIRELGKTTGLL